MNFEKFLKSLDGIKYRKGKDKEIFFPFSATTDDIQQVIEKSRVYSTRWHIVFSKPTDEVPNPEIRMYWE